MRVDCLGRTKVISYWWLANLDATFTDGKNCQLIQGGVHSSSYWSWLDYNILFKECSRENSQRLKGTPMRFLYNVSFTGMQSVTLIMEIGRSCNAYNIMVHAVLWGVWIIKSARGTAKWRSYERITCLQKPFKFATHLQCCWSFLWLQCFELLYGSIWPIGWIQSTYCVWKPVQFASLCSTRLCWALKIGPPLHCATYTIKCFNQFV